MTIPFEPFVLNPDKYLKIMMEFIGTTETSFTNKVLEKQKIPRAKVAAGIDLEIKGQDNIPKGAIIVASKHQSLWETQFLLGFFDNVSIFISL